MFTKLLCQQFVCVPYFIIENNLLSCTLRPTKKCRKLTCDIDFTLYVYKKNSSTCAPINQNTRYNPKVAEAINKQIQAEQQASQDYLKIAVTCLHSNSSRPGFGGFFMKMYHEEIQHMHQFIEYQLVRDSLPAISQITAPSIKDNISMIGAFKHALNMEIQITQLLQNLVRIAEEEKDYQCADFVTSIFLAEQVQSVHEMFHHIKRLSRICDNEHALYIYDSQLAKTFPCTYKIPVLKI